MGIAFIASGAHLTIRVKAPTNIHVNNDMKQTAQWISMDPAIQLLNQLVGKKDVDWKINAILFDPVRWKKDNIIGFQTTVYIMDKQKAMLFKLSWQDT